MISSNSAVSTCPVEGWKHRTTIVIPINPRPTPRPIWTPAGVRNPTWYQKYKQETIKAIGRGDLDLTGPIMVAVDCVVERPENPSWDFPTKGDFDSILKGIFDCITQAGGWWPDDRYIQRIESSEKRYPIDGETPHTKVEVYSR